MEHLKKDLTKVMAMSLLVIIIMVILVVWNSKTGILDNLAIKLF